VSTVVDKEFVGPIVLGSEIQKNRAILSFSQPKDKIIKNPSSLFKSSGILNHFDPSFVFFVPSQLECHKISPGPQNGVSSSPSGYRELEEDDTSLHAILNSLIPFIRDPKSSIQLPFYLGNFVLDSANCVGEERSSRPHVEGARKEFSWSRGLGIEYSSIKTRSPQEKLVVPSTLDYDSHPSTSSGALREMKALAGEK
jgi:hypothetical protein